MNSFRRATSSRAAARNGTQPYRLRHTRLTAYQRFIQTHELLIILIGCVLPFKFASCIQTHHFHLSRMGPRPFHLRSQVRFISRREVQTGAPVSDHLRRWVLARRDHRNSASKSLHDHQRSLKPIARAYQKASTAHPPEHLFARSVANESDSRQAEVGNLGRNSCPHWPIAQNEQRNLESQAFPCREHHSNAFLLRQAPNEETILSRRFLLRRARVGIHKVGFNNDALQRQSS